VPCFGYDLAVENPEKGGFNKEVSENEKNFSYICEYVFPFERQFFSGENELLYLFYRFVSR